MEVEEIINGCRNNDRKAQEALYHIMYKKCMRKIIEATDGNEHGIAEEIFNDGMLRVYKKVHLYDYKGTFYGWCYRILNNAIADKFKATKQYREKTVFYEKFRRYNHQGAETERSYDPLDTLSDSYGSYEISPCTGMTENVIYNTLERNSSKGAKGGRMMEIFRLHNAGYSHADIADLFNIGIGTSKWYLSQAREILTSKYKREDLEFSN